MTGRAAPVPAGAGRGGVQGDPGPPARDPRAPDEARLRRTEAVISAVLRVGVSASFVVIVGGLVADLVVHPGRRASAAAARHLLTAGAHYPHTFGAIFDGVGHGSATAIVALGLLMLVATPVARVAVSIAAFVSERDPLFVAVTSFVLTVLVASFALGKVGG